MIIFALSYKNLAVKNWVFLNIRCSSAVTKGKQGMVHYLLFSSISTVARVMWGTSHLFNPIINLHIRNYDLVLQVKKEARRWLAQKIFIRWTHTLFKKLCLVHLFKEWFPIYFSADLLCWSSKSCGLERKNHSGKHLVKKI